MAAATAAATTTPTMMKVAETDLLDDWEAVLEPAVASAAVASAVGSMLIGWTDFTVAWSGGASCGKGRGEDRD